MNRISQQDLKQNLFYDPVVGIFLWRKKIGRKGSGLGTVAKPRKHDGYVKIKIDGVEYAAHRLAWLYMTGNMPEVEIDHINRRRSDNSFRNLREATKKQQAGNTLARRTNHLGVKGVRRLPSGKYTVRLLQRTVGTFYTLDAARSAYEKAAIEHYGEFSLTGSGATL